MEKNTMVITEDSDFPSIKKPDGSCAEMEKNTMVITEDSDFPSIKKPDGSCAEMEKNTMVITEDSDFPSIKKPDGSYTRTNPEKKNGEKKDELSSEVVRKYYCEFCGISRSKKSLITSHILSTHKEIPPETVLPKCRLPKPYTCEECGVGFRKPAYLKQHMQSHSLERLFKCPEEKCSLSYRRKDHLTRHMRTHLTENVFECTVSGCGRKFPYKGNMIRHVQLVHRTKKKRPAPPSSEKLICNEDGCGKVFKYPSRLQHHTEVSHVKLESVGVLCAHPGCLKFFGNTALLKAHIRESHRRIKCKICGAKLIRSSIWSHSRLHRSFSRINCDITGCSRTFSNRSNMLQHVRAGHNMLQPYFCRRPNCKKRFSFRHVRDRHEKVGIHSSTTTQKKKDKKEMKSKEGKGKREIPTLEEMLIKKVKTSPVNKDSLGYLSWILFQK